jgi:hypothetical protein
MHMLREPQDERAGSSSFESLRMSGLMRLGSGHGPEDERASKTSWMMDSEGLRVIGLREPRLGGVGLLGEPGGELAQALQQVLEAFGIGDQEDARD